MQRLKCAKCSGEFYLKSGCSSCAPPTPCTYTCPQCGGTLHPLAPSYYVSDNWELD